MSTPVIDWTESNKRLRDENIRIAEERGRGELEQGDDTESIQLNLSASQIKKAIRRIKACQQKPINLTRARR